MLKPGEAVQAVRAFFDAYLVRRDLERSLACLTENVRWAGTGRDDPLQGRAQVRRAMEAEFRRAPGAYAIEYHRVDETPFTEQGALVVLDAAVCPAADGEGGLRRRMTIACAGERDGVCRIASLHACAPGEMQDEGAFFPAAPLPGPEYERQLGRKALDLLGKSVPGGMMGGYLEPGFPLYYVNAQMLSHLGYTYGEFVKAIEGKVINCMHPDDQAPVDALVAEAFRKGSDYEVRYRMRKKDGGYIWVNDIGKKGRASDGRAICISVIRDITTEVEARRRLEGQAKEYDRLFQSVLCGIVQYRFTGQRVVFQRANREAIRIFGYTPEEFWAKRDWDMAALIAGEDRERILSDVRRPRQAGDRSVFEYRLRQKNGGPCWVIGSAEVFLDDAGEQIVQSVFLDINGRKMAEQRSRLLAERVVASNEILRLALEHTAACEFYYAPKTRVCTVPERTRSIYHSRKRYEHMPESFAQEQVDPAYRPAFYAMYERIHHGERTAACEFRGLDGQFWRRETLTVISSGKDGAPQLVVGIAENITRQKQAELALEEARSRDGLTGVYNKENGLRLVQDYLARGRAQDEHCVLMLLDMDNFRDVNQKEGGVFADAILQEVADILRTETGPEDIRVRLGGDEFLLLVKRCDKKRAVDVGPRIAALVGKLMSDAEKDIRVSVSIGMCSTEVVEEYNALYRCAECTLKYVKENGKGRAACYLDTSNELGVFLTQLYTEKHALNAIDREAGGSGRDLLSFALELLGKSKNLNDAVFLLLSRIGKTYRLDRVSIIEADRAFLSYRFSYQWARNRQDLQMGRDFYASDEEFEQCIRLYGADGLADRNVREDISRFPSCLHAGIWNCGEYAGSMCFEVEQADYQWSQEQRDLLKELVKIVTSFIMKSKADAVSQAKTDFLSRMSHEIRTPMNAISGMTTIAKSVLDDRGKTLECLEKIESANAYLLSIINDILDMSRIESGKLELSFDSLDLAALLAGLEAMLYPQAQEKGLRLRFLNGRKENRPLRADGLRLNQVLVNIIGNALKFTERGDVTVRVDELEASPRAVLRFSVTDTGIGIEPAAMQRIFHAFEQASASTASSHGGTGLGLSISSRLVQMMGGVLEVRSEVGRGSTFFFTLIFDYAAPKAAAAQPQTAPAPLPDFHGRRVLLAEDNALNREIAQTILEMQGFEVTCAGDGRQALDQFCQGEPGRFDVILMDIRMPVMDGLEAARCIRTSGRPDARSVPIIALTANAFDEDTKKSIASGMDGHLSKPIQMKELLETLGRRINGGTDQIIGGTNR